MQRGQSSTLAQWQALLGVLLGLFLLAHLWQQWPVLEGREAWVDRAQHFALPWIGKLVLVAVLLAHAVLGIARGRQRRDASQPSAHPADVDYGPGLRRVQVALGLVVVGFLLVHWPLVAWSEGPHTTVRDVYAKLWTQLGTPLQLSLHTLGIAAVCAHLGLGLGRGAVTLGFAETKAARTVCYWLFGIVAALVFALWLQALAAFAVGAPLFTTPLFTFTTLAPTQCLQLERDGADRSWVESRPMPRTERSRWAAANET